MKSGQVPCGSNVHVAGGSGRSGQTTKSQISRGRVSTTDISSSESIFRKGFAPFSDRVRLKIRMRKRKEERFLSCTTPEKNIRQVLYLLGTGAQHTIPLVYPVL